MNATSFSTRLVLLTPVPGWSLVSRTITEVEPGGSGHVVKPGIPDLETKV